MYNVQPQKIALNYHFSLHVIQQIIKLNIYFCVFLTLTNTQQNENFYILTQLHCYRIFSTDTYFTHSEIFT